MGRGEGQAVHSWLIEWRSAIRELPDNPLSEQLGLARRRAQRRVSPLRRALLPLLLLACFALLFYLLVYRDFSSISSERDLMVMLATFALSMAGLYWLVLLCQGVFEALGDAMALLTHRSRGEQRLSLDESLAATPLSSKEILAGTLAVIAPTLLRRVLGGGLLFAAICLTVASGGLLDFDTSEFWGALLAAPFGILTMSLSGSLALFSLLLCFVCFGLGQRTQLTASAAGAIHAGAQFFYPLCALPPLFMAMESGIGSSMDLPLEMVLQGFLLLALCHMLFIWAVLHLSSRSRSARAFWAIAVPFFLPLVLACAIAYESSDLGSSEFMALHSIWVWGSFALANPLASLGSLSFGGMGSDAYGTDPLPTLELIRLGLLFLLQLGVLTLSAIYAERAVDAWRGAGEGSG